MTPEEKKQILILAKGALSKEEFLLQYSVDLKHLPDHILNILNNAFLEKDADAVECAVILGFCFSFPDNCIDVLCKLLDEDWHYKHEDIVRILEEKRDPSTIESLYRTAITRLHYLEYNDSSALAVKCVWALGKIGTPAAVEKLRLIVNSEEREDVIKTAKYQLQRLN